MASSIPSPLSLPNNKSLITQTKDRSGRKYFYLPNTMADWPWPRRLNLHHEDIAGESKAWFQSFKPYASAESQRAHDKLDCDRLAALAFPDASRALLRSGADLVNFTFLIDEYTDVEPAPVVRGIAEVVLDALHNPEKPRPDGEVVLGKMASQFWLRARPLATPEGVKHFLDAFADYLHGVICQAEDRDNDTVHTIESYFEARRRDVGVSLFFALARLHLSLPDEVVHHPNIKPLEIASVDLVILDNDLVSYNKEQATGDDKRNILTFAMHHLRVDLEGAVDWVARYHKEIQARFMDALKHVPSFGAGIDGELQEHIKNIANWPRCNYCWSFDSGRYFGSKGYEYEKTRLVPMLPKRARNTNLHQEQVEVPHVEMLESMVLDPLVKLQGD